MIGTVSDRNRIGRALEITFQLFSANFCQMMDGHFAWQAQYWWVWRVRFVAPRIGNDVLLWQDQAYESFCVTGAVLGEAQVSLSIVGAVLGEGQVSLFVAGTVIGEIQVSLCVVGAGLGEVQVWLCVVGAVLAKIWKNSLNSKCCIFQYKMLVRSAKSNLCCVAGCGLTGTVSERSRIVIGSAVHWK